jgi:hypothetical protein
MRHVMLDGSFSQRCKLKHTVVLLRSPDYGFDSPRGCTGPHRWRLYFSLLSHVQARTLLCNSALSVQDHAL